MSTATAIIVAFAIVHINQPPLPPKKPEEDSVLG
jgi:hypothetical protein